MPQRPFDLDQETEYRLQELYKRSGLELGIALGIESAQGRRIPDDRVRSAIVSKYSEALDMAVARIRREHPNMQRAGAMRLLAARGWNEESFGGSCLRVACQEIHDGSKVSLASSIQ